MDPFMWITASSPAFSPSMGWSPTRSIPLTSNPDGPYDSSIILRRGPWERESARRSWPCVIVERCRLLSGHSGRLIRRSSHRSKVLSGDSVGDWRGHQRFHDTASEREAHRALLINLNLWSPLIVPEVKSWCWHGWGDRFLLDASANAETHKAALPVL